MQEKVSRCAIPLYLLFLTYAVFRSRQTEPLRLPNKDEMIGIAVIAKLLT